MKLRTRLGIGAAALCAASAAGAAPQGRGDYLNFESPQVKPIAVATVENRRYLFVCNTPDNSVDVFSLDRMELASEQVTTSPALLPADPDAADRDRGYAARIPVGLEPVSLTLATIEGTTRLYTANWLGDSVTYVKLTSPAGISDEEVAFTYEIERVVHVGDEPMCVAVMTASSSPHLFVTKRTASSYSQLDPITGTFRTIEDSNPSIPDAAGNGADVIMTTNGLFANAIDDLSLDEGIDPVSPPNGDMALKEPHTVAVAGTKLWVLGQQGGGSKLSHDDNGPDNPGGEIPGFNLDLWSIVVPSSGVPTPSIIPPMISGQAAPPTQGTGTTNLNMAATDSWVYVVSTDAMNADVGNPALLSRPTGFVRTVLSKIDSVTGAVYSRDLNTLSNGGAVTKSDSLAHCMDVAVFRGQKVCVVGFNSDRFALVNTNAGPGQQAPALWQIERTNITGSNDDDDSLTGMNIAGPRALAVALDPSFPSGSTTRPGDRIYVLNRLDHSISVIDPNLTPANRQTFGFALPTDPLPDHIRRGQQFLYSATLGSASGFVSCASCHVDSRSDQLQWRLGPSEDLDFPAAIHSPLDIAVDSHELNPLSCCVEDDFVTTDSDGDGFPSALVANRDLPLADGTSPGCTVEGPGHTLAECAPRSQHATNNAKGPMVTQSLQGLLNFEVASGTSLVTNAPYHWRGDKPDFDSFNEAFVGLQGLPDIMDGNPATEPNAGFTPEEMADYTTFINSVHYPPNPLQPRTRTYAGSLGDPDHLNASEPNLLIRGEGTLRGLKLFHTMQTGGLVPRSCVQCHFLPEGSNNRLTFVRSQQVDNAQLYAPNELKFQPIESAALRGLTQKEGRLALDASISDTITLRTGDVGLGHDGMEGLDRNDFLFPVLNAVLGNYPGDDADLEANIEDIADFTRRIDHGIAPIVGRMMSVRPDEVSGGGIAVAAKEALLDDMEAQVKQANAGLAVYVRDGALDRFFWYDLLTASAGQEPLYRESGGPGSPLSRQDLIGLLTSATPDILVFASTSLGSDRRVASAFGLAADAAGSTVRPSGFVMVETRPNTAYRVITELTANLPGVPHNSGHGLPGLGPIPGPGLFQFRSLTAETLLQRSIIPNDSDPLTPSRMHDASRRLRVSASDLTHGAMVRLWIPVSGSSNTILEMPIYPSNEFEDGARVWETAVELDPLNTYALRLGGFTDSQVLSFLDGTATAEIDPPPAPANYTWEVSNSDSTTLLAVQPFKYTLEYDG